MFFNIPIGLRQLKQWVVWNEVYSAELGKTLKVPSPSVNSVVLYTYQEAIDKQLLENHKGIGFVLKKDDPYVCIDLDDPRRSYPDDQAAIDKTLALHNNIVAQANSYTETSISGAGKHIFMQGTWGGKSRNALYCFEVYEADRFIAVTGNVFMGMGEIRSDQEFLDSFRESSRMNKRDPALDMDAPLDRKMRDAKETFEKARNAFNGEKFMSLWSTANPLDWSTAHAQLISMLDYWTADQNAICEIVANSPLVLQSDGNASESRPAKSARIIGNELMVARANNNRDKTDPAKNKERDYFINHGRAQWDNVVRHFKELEAKAKLQAEADLSAERNRNKSRTSFSKNHRTPKLSTTAKQIYTCAVDNKLLASGFDWDAKCPAELETFVQMIYQRSRSPIRQNAMLVAITALSGIFAHNHKIGSRHGSGINTSFMLFAPTGTGKSAAYRGFTKLLTDAVSAHNFDRDVQKNYFVKHSKTQIPKSAQIFQYEMQQAGGAGSCFYDEAGAFIMSLAENGMAADKERSEFISNAFEASYVTKGSSGPVSVAARNEGRHKPIYNMSVSQLWMGTTNDAALFDSGNAGTGLQSRFQYAVQVNDLGADHTYDNPTFDHSAMKMLFDAIRTMNNSCTDETVIQYPDAAKAEAMNVLTYDLDALELKNHAEQLLTQIRIDANNAASDDVDCVFNVPAYYTAVSRVMQHVERVAGLLPVLRGDSVIRKSDFRWAFSMVMAMQLEFLSLIDQGTVGSANSPEYDVLMRKYNQFAIRNGAQVDVTKFINQCVQVQPFKGMKGGGKSALVRGVIQDMVRLGVFVECEGGRELVRGEHGAWANLQ